MIRLIQRRLIIPRGDTGTFTIPVVASNNTSDVAVFTIFSEMTKKKIYEKIVAIDSDTITVEFAHGDTVNLPVGKYVWDIKFYKNPVFVDDVLVNGDEIDSYYAAFTLPVCEIRQTGDTLLTADDAPTATIAPEYLNIVNAAISETLHNKNLAAESAAAAETSAANASSYLADTLAAKEVAEARVNEIENLSVEVNTGAEGSDASVTYTPATGVLSFEIPRGDTGNGIASCVLNADFTLTINYTDGTSLTTIPIRGDTPHLTIGEVTEGPNAIATITGTDANPILNLTLPNANVPTRVSQLENDSGYLTEHQDLSDYVQKTDYATKSTAGIVKVAGLGVKMDNDELTLAPASPRQIKQGTGDTAPIVAAKEHESTFYGLAKAAGDTTQSQSSNAVGTYTDEAKAAIQQMLDVPSTDDIPEVPVQDVQIDGTSIVESGVANIPVASTNNLGIAKVGDLGITISYMSGSEGVLAISAATYNDIKASSGHFKAITPSTQNRAVFYGLAKAAGDTTQSQSDNAVGTYTDSAKTAIQTMLDVPSTAAMTTAISNAIGNINSFDMAVVQALPTEDISTHTIYLVPKTGETNDVYDEYIYINNAWEMVGNTQVDLSNYVQKTDYATASNAGVVKINPSAGIAINKNSHVIGIYPSLSEDIKAGTEFGRPITPLHQHESTFYGLAAAAGDSTQSSSDNAVGTYTDEAKAAIQTMLDVPAKADIPDTSIYATKADTVLETTLSRGRKANSHAGIWSIAWGNNVTALGDLSHAEGYNTSATGALSSVFGKNNVEDSYDSWPEWTGNTFYVIGDKVKITNGNTIKAYICKEDNNDAEFTASKWTARLTGMMNYVEIVGNGELNAFSNAYALDWDGNGHYAGDVYVHANADSTGGTKLATVKEIPNVPVQDVQINGTSVLENGVANVPIISALAFGVAKANPAFGVSVNGNGFLEIVRQNTSLAKSGTDNSRPVVSSTQHESTFYGLSKVAGVDLANETVTLGEYPDAAKTAIKNMIGVEEGLKVVRLI